MAFVSGGGSDLASTDIYSRESDGGGQPELLVDIQEPIGEVTYSPDGEWVIYRGGTQSDIYGKRIGSNEDPINFSLSSSGAGSNEANASVSPDGRWLAYQSNESGRWEIYVHPFPNVDDARWQVSTQGGRTPVWARGGHELYYVSLLDTRLMAVPITEGTTFIHGEPTELFVIQGLERAGAMVPFYDVMPGDERFVMILDDQVGGRLIFVENFLQELSQRAGN